MLGNRRLAVLLKQVIQSLGQKRLLGSIMLYRQHRQLFLGGGGQLEQGGPLPYPVGPFLARLSGRIKGRGGKHLAKALAFCCGHGFLTPS